MVEIDRLYFSSLMKGGWVRSPFLEVGSARVQGEEMPNLCDLARGDGLEIVSGTDITRGSGVDFVSDFSLPREEFAAQWDAGLFETVALFNVLEHVFDPYGMLCNALRCVRPGGTLVVVVPSVWGIHNYPKDYMRFLPDWFEEFGSRNNISLSRETFCFLSSFGVLPVDALQEGGQYCLPNFMTAGKSGDRFRYWISRVVHRIFDTYGRNHVYTNCSIGSVFKV